MRELESVNVAENEPIRKKSKLPSTLLNEDCSNYFEDNESFIDLSNITPDIMKNGPSIPYAEKMRLEKSEAADKKWAKVEVKTEKLLEKASRIKEASLGASSPESGNKLAINNAETHPKTKRDASFFTYICLPPRKLPRKILDHVKANAFKDPDGNWFSKIDTFELKEVTKTNSHQASNTIRQLRDEGFYDILDFSTAGYRLLKINPETYGLK